MQQGTVERRLISSWIPQGTYCVAGVLSLAVMGHLVQWPTTLGIGRRCLDTLHTLFILSTDAEPCHVGNWGNKIICKLNPLKSGMCPQKIIHAHCNTTLEFTRGCTVTRDNMYTMSKQNCTIDTTKYFLVTVLLMCGIVFQILLWLPRHSTILEIVSTVLIWAHFNHCLTVPRCINYVFLFCICVFCFCCSTLVAFGPVLFLNKSMWYCQILNDYRLRTNERYVNIHIMYCARI